MLQYRIEEAGGVKYIAYKGFQKVRAVFSTRIGGVSSSPFASLNLGLHTGDDRQAVLQNRTLFAGAVGTAVSRWVTAQQVHGSHVMSVHNEHAGRGHREQADAIPCSDGMVTGERQLPLVTFYADCVPVYLVDETKPAVALVHAGWKGTVARIAANGVQKMIEEYGCSADRIKAIIGPSIGPCCYQVDRPVIDKFTAVFGDTGDLLSPQGEGYALLDLWQANSRVLQEAGISLENIYITGLCTCCHKELFYSYRRDRGKTGRMAALIMILS
ncbi:MAG: peptidoglycan editing factor PgeF [Thermoanaerobacteraceae bacterium]|nr:peptidoglycan editing factor PgeF [Thermoanaerobacteraceae bacterium]